MKTTGFVPAIVLILVSLIFASLTISCDGRGEKIMAVKRETLFSLSYGPLEDQVNIFRVEGMSPPLKTRITMRDGLFFVSNGNSAKVLTLSSFGDLLSMVYNPDRNPRPIVLEPSGKGSAGRTATGYPFQAPGEIAVDSSRHIYVEDRLPEDRRVFDAAADTALEYVVLRFTTEGEFQDFLGQEGIGGTPFPLILSIHVTVQDDCVVVCATRDAWLVYWFDSRGLVKSSIRIRRDSLPLPDDRDLIASLDKIVPDPEGGAIFLKMDYYYESIDPATKTRSGISYDRAFVYRMDSRTAAVTDRYEILPFEPSGYNAQEGNPPRVWEFLGAVRARNLFFTTTDESGNTYIALYNGAAKTLRRYSIQIEPEEQEYTTLFLSPEGILCALAGTRFEARFVWWRFDRILQGGSL